MQWILLIVAASISGVSITTIQMTEPQCREAVRQLYPLKKRLQASCVGVKGEAFGFLDLDK